MPMGQAPEPADPEDPIKSPPRPTSPATSTRQVRCGSIYLTTPCSRPDAAGLRVTELPSSCLLGSGRASALPPFDRIQGFCMPSGVVTKVEFKGFHGCIGGLLYSVMRVVCYWSDVYAVNSPRN